MRVIVSGSKGFMGSHLVDKLIERGHIVLGMDKKDGASTSDLLKLRNAIGSFGIPDVFVHLGANCSSQISLREPYTDFHDNVVGLFNVCEMARQYHFPIIFNSSMKVYPGNDGVISPYGTSKQTGELYLKTYKGCFDVDYIINRPSSVFGPRQDGSDDGGWLTWFLKASVTGKTINLYGDGTQSRDMLYIDDCVDLLVDQVENFDKWKNETYDFGGGVENELSLNELLDHINYHNTKTYPRLKGDVQRFVNSNKLAMEKGWTPKVNWREGVKKTLEWLKSQS